MYKFLFIILFPLMPFLSFSQGCYDIFEDAFYLSKFDEYRDLADSILDVEISNGTQDFNVFLLKSKMLYQKGDSTAGFQFLLKAVKYGCDIGHNIFTNPFFKKVISKSDSLQIIEIAEKDVEIPFNTANKRALYYLYQLTNWDQALNNFTIRFHDSMCIKPAQSRIYELSITRKMLRKYLKDYGYPDVKEFGEVLVDKFDLVIIHHFQQVDSCEWLKPYYDEALKNNKISPQRYFNYFDKLLLYRDLPLKYCAISAGKTNNIGTFDMYPVEDIENIDALRKRLCLSPLHVFLKKYFIEIPEGYTYDMNSYINDVRLKLKKIK